MINVRLAAVCPPSSLSSWWPLCYFLSLFLSPLFSPSLSLSFLAFFFMLLPCFPFLFLSKHWLFTVFFAWVSMQDMQIWSCTHTSLSLFNHWLYYRGYFPRQYLWRRWARQAEWEREISLSLITWKPQYWHSHWLRWMNLIYLPFEAQMTSWYGSLSLYRRRPLFFCTACEIWKYTGRHLKGFWQRLICFVPWRDSCVSLSI